jgi:hypothetical protein
MNKKALTAPGLDFSNNPQHKDIDLNFYPFVDSKIVHSKNVHSRNNFKMHKKLKMKMILK